MRWMFLYSLFVSLICCRTSTCIYCLAYLCISSSSETDTIILPLWLQISPKCKKTFSSFLSMLSWSLLRSSWYCCCLILATMYSASCKGKQQLRPDNQPAHSCNSHKSSNVREKWGEILSVLLIAKHLSHFSDTLWATYCGWKFNSIVQIPEPEEVCEPMCDIKRVELFITQIQESQNICVILISPANTKKRVQSRKGKDCISIDKHIKTPLVDHQRVCFFSSSHFSKTFVNK